MQFTKTTRARRKPSLTPMIDVVFLLLVFFMLASRFGIDQVLPLPLAGGDATADFSGKPRLVDILPDTMRLNGIEQSEAALLAGLRELVSAPGDAIILRPGDKANVQRIVVVSELLRAAGFVTLVLVD